MLEQLNREDKVRFAVKQALEERQDKGFTRNQKRLAAIVGFVAILSPYLIRYLP